MPRASQCSPILTQRVAQMRLRNYFDRSWKTVCFSRRKCLLLNKFQPNPSWVRENGNSQYLGSYPSPYYCAGYPREWLSHRCQV